MPMDTAVFAGICNRAPICEGVATTTVWPAGMVRVAGPSPSGKVSFERKKNTALRWRPRAPPLKTLTGLNPLTRDLPWTVPTGVRRYLLAGIGHRNAGACFGLGSVLGWDSLHMVNHQHFDRLLTRVQLQSQRVPDGRKKSGCRSGGKVDSRVSQSFCC